MKPYELRVIQEKNELDEKLTKLLSFIGSDIWSNLDEESKDLLFLQSQIMEDYSEVLGQRIDKFRVEV